MNKFNLKIITPQGVYREVEAKILNVRTTGGNIGILANHMPLASGIEVSQLSYETDSGREEFAISGGFVYVGLAETTVIANAIESRDEIDVERAHKAKERAEKRLKAKSDKEDMLKAEVSLKRAINRINVKGL